MLVSQTVTDFTTLVIQSGEWEEIDRLYLENKVLCLIGEEMMENTSVRNVEQSALELVELLLAKAQENQVIGDLQAETDILEAQLMDLLTPSPSAVNKFFSTLYDESPEKATSYFYRLCQENNYIKTKAIAQNLYFPVETDYGTLEITINLSKPEKDPKQIEAERNAPSIAFPKCMLCMENEGYQGRLNYPARTNHRIIRMDIADEKWGFQYSPYAYYNEHSIILSEEHRPMLINEKTFQRLLNITEVLPHYFVGSNADLPIVGGSILSHDHYQAGRHTFPMAKASVEQKFIVPGFEQIHAGIVKWPMSVIRLSSRSQEDLIQASVMILEKWRSYSDPTVRVSAYSEDGTPHHTITPIARRNGELFELDLVLRDNNTSEDHPDGIFHPHKNVQHIKKENIGLIEVMGLAILPPRLADEIKEVENYLLNKPNIINDRHLDWANQLKEQNFTAETVRSVIENSIGHIFEQVLIDAGVFKRDTEGQEAFQRFINYL
ncbi:UDP-glucose--hexose-1-phosphate uridylyltransferase [Enterococcus sp. BWT-B8]|uniref:UDP-glucose--hexose-1-phosphate uridylyltransferase n=1 Tax=Enterococcus sp. BWT-B8 TaxID=2885157 RepID=UPI001E5B676F|nr:UDP-glucose--hexose-1-phosphate uridylyltransferase [Enterococcus sp. BWT-B8]MCB5952564.1 UDP-glucose--hexose-1-phosphate uridylyltransferase [Enterococcus sp. BWT-B8]